MSGTGGMGVQWEENCDGKFRWKIASSTKHVLFSLFYVALARFIENTVRRFFAFFGEGDDTIFLFVAISV